MLEAVLLAGFGGQGILSTGMLLSYAGMEEGLHVSWIPSYGPEMRGGTANCAVTVSDAPISSPLVTEPTTLIAMNLPSLEKYETSVRPGGLILYNASLIYRLPERQDARVLGVKANEVAESIGNIRVAANVMLGAFIEVSQAISLKSALEALTKVLPPHRHKLIPANQKALQEGARIAREAGLVNSVNH
ncbi:MAG: 2-oxoacid:ferredoxin oxidoreductase subunit gamma [Ammonifex sp.]|jgi:2-oxoglutarate ferredoxin oxidoreductase subunit gamma|nr:MAG: 2-oxoacid:ferredoxin oxidoreductase subunit gamma [Ammonifex sp.]